MAADIPTLLRQLADAQARIVELETERDAALEAKDRAEDDLAYMRYRHAQEMDEARARSLEPFEVPA